MKGIFIAPILSFSLLFSALSFAEPANLTLLQQEILVYHDSGQYEKELTQAILQAQNYIDAEVTANKNQGSKKKLAIVLDIDETSLSNYPNMIKRHFVADRTQIHQDILAATAPAITPTLMLYKDALKKGVVVFFITGRASSELAATETNLKNAGFEHWSGLYLRPDSYNESSIAPFKTQTREAISKQGYTIVASIGDQYSDINGGFTQKGFKLPNPYYYLP